jgi:hypothetical protein
MPGMRGEADRQKGPNSAATSSPRSPVSAIARQPYDAPRLTVYGSLVDLTQRRGGPGRDNPHFRNSF